MKIKLTEEIKKARIEFKEKGMTSERACVLLNCIPAQKYITDQLLNELEIPICLKKLILLNIKDFEKEYGIGIRLNPKLVAAYSIMKVLSYNLLGYYTPIERICKLFEVSKKRLLQYWKKQYWWFKR